MLNQKSYFKYMFTLILVVAIFFSFIPLGAKVTAEEDDDVYEISIYYYPDWWNTTAQWGDDVVSQYIEENLGVRLNRMKPDTDPDQALATLFASEDLPDVIWLERNQNYRNLKDQGRFVDLKDIIYDYPHIVEGVSENSLKLFDEADGGIYGIPHWPRNKPSGGNVGWIKTIKSSEATGDMPTGTLNEVYEFAKCIQEKYPTANGQNVVPILVQNDSSLRDLVYRALGGFTVSGQMTVKGDQLVWRYEDPLFLEANQYISKLYREGLLAPDFITISDDDAQVREKLAAGAFGIYAGGNIPALGPQELNTLQLLKDTDPDDGYIGMPHVGSEKVPVGEVRGEIYGTMGWGYYTITQQAGNIDKILEFMDWSLSREGSLIMTYGPPGYLYDELDDEGYPLLNRWPSELSIAETRELGLWEWMNPAQSDYIDDIKFEMNARQPGDNKDWGIEFQRTVLTPALWNVGDEFFGAIEMIDNTSELGIARNRIEEFLLIAEADLMTCNSDEEVVDKMDEINAFIQDNMGEEIRQVYQEKWEANREILGGSDIPGVDD